MSLLLAMLMLLGTWLLIGSAVLCLGAGVWRLLGLERGAGEAVEPPASETSENLDLLPDRFRLAHPPPQLFVGPLDAMHRAAMSFGLGLAALAAFLMAWNLALPVALPAILAVGMLAMLSGVWAWPEIKAALRTVLQAHVTVLIGWLLVGVWLTNRAASGAELAVTGLAWYPLVAWIDAYPAIPGVGNLNPIYGWNAGGLLVSGLLSEGPWVGRVGHASNGWLLWWLSLPALVAWSQLWAAGKANRDRRPRGYVDAQNSARKATVGCVYDAAWLVPLAVLAMGTAATDPLPGVGAGLLLWLAGGAVLRMSGPDEPHRGRRIDALIAALLCCVGAAVWDPMAIPAACVLGVVVIWRLMKSERAWVEGRRPTRSIGFDHEKLPGLGARSGSVTAVAAIASCVLGLWMARNVVLTGLPAFPLTASAGLPLEWAVSSRDASLNGWLPRPEPVNAAIGAAAIVFVPALAGVILVMAWFSRGGAEGRWKACGGPALALAAAAGAWLVTGQGISAFGPAFAAMAAGLALNACAVVQRGRPVKTPAGSTLAGTLGIAALLLATVHVLTAGGAALWPMGPRSQAAMARESPNENSGTSSDEVAVSPGKLMPIRLPTTPTAGLAPKRQPDLQPWRSQWGVEVALTAASPMAAIIERDPDEPATGPLPWSAPQPSLTQAPSEFLRYRGGPDKPEAGFVIDRGEPGSFAQPDRRFRSADRDQSPRDGS